jgi:FtsP/CotA-like multicopper oxidase with cupredoxin domain
VQGSEESVHNYHWHGNTLLWDGRRVDQINLLGGNAVSMDMMAENPGTWVFHCHVSEQPAEACHTQANGRE